MIKISKPSKMKIEGKKVGCWSLEARVSCPGSKHSDGSIVEVCKSCYATKGMYRFPVVKAVRANNKADYHRDDWVDDMVKEVSKYDYFRWFDSGDIETPELATKIAAVISETPSVKHWVPTRADKVDKINEAMRSRSAVPTFQHPYGQSLINLRNVSVRISADHIGLNNTERVGVNSYVINKEDLFEAKRQGIFACPVSLPGSTQKSCDTCTHCYGPEKVAYVLH